MRSKARLKKNKSKVQEKELNQRLYNIIDGLDPRVRSFAIDIKNKPTPNLSRKEIMKLPLSEVERSVILGTLLGDGSLKLQKNYANARLVFRHSVTQTEYFFTKVFLLNSISGKGSITPQNNEGADGGYGSNPKFRYASKALPSLTIIWKQIGGNQKTIKRSWLNLLTPLSLAIWWCDDGSLIANGRHGLISTDSYSQEEVKILQQWLVKRWGIQARILRCWRQHRTKEVLTDLVPKLPVVDIPLDKLETNSNTYLDCGYEEMENFNVQEGTFLQNANFSPSMPFVQTSFATEEDQEYAKFEAEAEARTFGEAFDHKAYTHSENYLTTSKIVGSEYYYKLNFGAIELQKFLILISPHCPCESMLYKFIIRYNSTSHQERWISQLENLLPDNLKSKCRTCYATSKL